MAYFSSAENRNGEENVGVIGVMAAAAAKAAKWPSKMWRKCQHQPGGEMPMAA